MSGLTTPSDTQTPVNKLAGKYFIAEVRDNNDPKKLQRVRISIPEVIESDSVENLPWAVPVVKSSGLDNLTMDVPIVGSFVIVTLQDGDPHFPLYFGALAAEYSGGVSNAVLSVNYPARHGRKLGTSFWYIDKTSGELRLFHKSANITIDTNGNVTVTTAGNVHIGSQGTLSLQADGPITMNAADVNITASSSINFTAPSINHN